MIKCIIVDDEPNAVALLEKYIARFDELALVGSCYDGVEALSLLRNHTIDVVFLDINMPEINGMELAKMLSPNQRVVFTTAYSEYAVESYEYKALDYLLKPITFVRFTAAVQKILETAQESISPKSKPNWLLIKSGTELLRLNPKDIRWIKGEREYVSIHIDGKKHLVYKRMKELISELPHTFVRVHHSYIVNVEKIEKIIDHKVFVEGEAIPISQTYRSEFMKMINKD